MINEIIGERQNSSTLWGKQEAWDIRLTNLISRLSDSVEPPKQSIDYGKLDDMIEFIRNLEDAETREIVMGSWNLSFDPEEIEYMQSTLDQGSH